jgi:hypothetical protein
MEISQKAKARTALWSSDTAPGHLPKEMLSKDTVEHLHTNVHHSTIHNSQAMETTQWPTIDEWIKKIWYIYTKWSFTQS